MHYKSVAAQFTSFELHRLRRFRVDALGLGFGLGLDSSGPSSSWNKIRSWWCHGACLWRWDACARIFWHVCFHFFLTVILFFEHVKRFMVTKDTCEPDYAFLILINAAFVFTRTRMLICYKLPRNETILQIWNLALA